MLHYLLPIIIVSLSACGGETENPDYTTEQGIQVFDPEHLVAQSEIETATEQTLILTKLSDLAGWDLHFQKLPIDHHNQIYAGLTIISDDETKMIVQQSNRSCIAYTAINHELTHAIEFEITRNGDPEHTNPVYWDPTSGIAALSNTNTRQLLCP